MEDKMTDWKRLLLDALQVVPFYGMPFNDSCRVKGGFKILKDCSTSTFISFDFTMTDTADMKQFYSQKRKTLLKFLTDKSLPKYQTMLQESTDDDIINLDELSDTESDSIQLPTILDRVQGDNEPKHLTGSIKSNTEEQKTTSLTTDTMLTETQKLGDKIAVSYSDEETSDEMKLNDGSRVTMRKEADSSTTDGLPAFAAKITDANSNSSCSGSKSPSILSTDNPPFLYPPAESSCPYDAHKLPVCNTGGIADCSEHPIDNKKTIKHPEDYPCPQQGGPDNEHRKRSHPRTPTVRKRLKFNRTPSRSINTSLEFTPEAEVLDPVKKQSRNLPSTPQSKVEGSKKFMSLFRREKVSKISTKRSSIVLDDSSESGQSDDEESVILIQGKYCGRCLYCKDMKIFGGQGRFRRGCVHLKSQKNNTP